jgi:hypothetical protein
VVSAFFAHFHSPVKKLEQVVKLFLPVGFRITGVTRSL